MLLNNCSTSSNETPLSDGSSFSGHDPCLEMGIDRIESKEPLPTRGPGDCPNGEGDIIHAAAELLLLLLWGVVEDWVEREGGRDIGRISSATFAETDPISEILGEEGYSSLDDCLLMGVREGLPLSR